MRDYLPFRGQDDVVAASYPNFAGKHDQDAFFNPSDFVAYMRSQGRLSDVLIDIAQRSDHA